MSRLLDTVNNDYLETNKHDYPDFRTGDTIAVHVKIQEGNRSRIQVFQGTCIAIKEKERLNGHFRVRKTGAGGVGVERVFPYFTPSVAKIDVIAKGKSRRAKLYYLRDLTGKKARIAVDYNRD
ncbi:50S ribosomal protein L19 [Bacteriovoracaceae bacterium]|nr:50S ribosomal protein L19 [Bacteriovoracaceae bacterium]